MKGEEVCGAIANVKAAIEGWARDYEMDVSAPAFILPAASHCCERIFLPFSDMLGVPASPHP